MCDITEPSVVVHYICCAMILIPNYLHSW